MPLQDEIDALKAEVARDTNVISSAVTLINGIQAAIDAAVAAAVANGATATQLADIQAVSDSLKANDDALAAAVAAQTPAAPTP
jgi:hypothetical protein